MPSLIKSKSISDFYNKFNVMVGEETAFSALKILLYYIIVALCRKHYEMSIKYLRSFQREPGILLNLIFVS